MASDHDQAHARAPETLTIAVVRARDLRGQKGDNVQCLVKVEFGEKSLGESPKVECTPESPAEINFNATMSVNTEDAHTLDELAYKPVLCTVIEALPSEKQKKDHKKQKEEKTAVLGQCTVDLMPLLEGKTQHRYTLAINPLPGSPLENLPAEHPRPELDVQISVMDSILSETQLENCNLMSVTAESLYSPPDSWTMSGQQYMYTAALPLPLAGERENTVVFAGGQLRPGVEKEAPNKNKKWAMPGEAQGNAAFIADKMLAADAMEDEDGDYRNKEDREHRSVSEQDKNRVIWNVERRSFLDAAAAKNFQEKIAKTRYWPVEVARTVLPSGGKGKKDEDAVSFHGVVYLNLAPLLYPGVKRIRGAYKVHGFSDAELMDKANRKGSIADEALKIASGILSRSSSSPYPKPTKAKDEAKGKEAKKGSKQKGEKEEKVKHESQPTPAQASVMKATDSTSEAEGSAVNAEGMQYVEAKSYMMVEICLNRPLVPKRTTEQLAQRVAEYIPPRPLFPKRANGAERAVEDFHNQVGVVANLVLDEFREHFGEELTKGDAPQTPEAMEARRQKLIYQLNSSGKYFAFKEQLKHAVVKIVREKYLKTSSFKDKDELQSFLSELYVYLLDQMHVGLGNVLSVEDQSPIPDPLTDSAQLKHFAREAEVNGNFELAARYYQERIARDKNDSDHWLDYGTFCLYINDLTKAEECFKECVAIDQRHLSGLTLYGVVCTMQDKHDAAETFFEAATSFYPTSIQAWTMLGLFYDGIGNDIGAEMALTEANKLNVSAAKSEQEAEKEKERETEREKETGTEPDKEKEDEEKPETAQEETEEHPTPDSENKEGSSAPDVPTIRQIPSSPTSLAGSDSKKNVKDTRRNSALRKSELLTVVKEGPARPPTVNKKTPSSLRLRKQRSSESRLGSGRARSPAQAAPDEQEEAPPPREPTPVPSQSIFMHVVEFLLEVKAMPFTERALAHDLLDPLGGPSAEYHICLARLKLQKQELDEAETSLKEALQFEHQNPNAWAIMGHVKYLQGETEVAKDCYERTLSFTADPSETHSIYLRLASIYLQEARFAEAKNTFLMACKRTPSCVSWLGVGIACYRLEELSDAEDALSEANILNNTDPEVWAFLSLVCLRTGRQLEAEQAYKYAVKLNLPEEDLLNELHQLQEEVGFGNPQL